MSRELHLKIGGIVLALTSVDGSEFEVERAYDPFVTDHEAEVMLRVQGRTGLTERLGEPVFDSAGAWSLYRDRGKWIISVRSPALGPHPYQMAAMEPDFRAGDIYVEVQQPGQDLPPNPLGYPLAQVLMINLLSLGRGVLLHACGLSDRGRGLVFAGTSGAGKSTMAELWKDQEGATILSDDRIIVREDQGGFWAYGTPWHGDARVSSPARVPIDAIFFIRHGEENSATLFQPQDAISSLLVRSFPTFWSAEGMAFTLEFLGRVSQQVACYDLPFLPDKSIVEFVRSMDLI